MKTPKSYTQNLKNHTITTQMLVDCLFSVNKRAKNYRDQERKYRHGYDYYGNEEKNREKKEEYYRKKDLMLSIVNPVCIHREVFKRSWERIYDYEDEYGMYRNDGEFVHTGVYWDKKLERYVEFGDVIVEKTDYRLYLFYDLGGSHTFHTPINDIPKEYENLEIIDIDELCTYGYEVEELISNQFVTKVIGLIESGEYELVA